MMWLNPARSSQSQFQETIVPRVALVTLVPLRYQQSAKHKGPRSPQSFLLSLLGDLEVRSFGGVSILLRNKGVVGYARRLAGRRKLQGKRCDLHISTFLHFYTSTRLKTKRIRRHSTRFCTFYTVKNPSAYFVVGNGIIFAYK